jgi:hypothetical protein
MPKQKKKSKQHEDDEFDDMLAEFQAADLTTASNATSPPAASSSSKSARTDARPSLTSLPSQAAENATRPHVSEEAIINASSVGNLAQLQHWGRQGVRVRTGIPLFWAVYNRASLDVLFCLVKELGADINHRYENGITALSAAAEFGHHDTARYLVEELGADVDSRDNLGRTPLYLAASHGRLAVVRVLLHLGADIDRRDTHGGTPLMIASVKKQREVVKWLVKAGADTQTLLNNDPALTVASGSRAMGASVEQTAYLEAKTHCSNDGCSGAGVMKCTGCKQARYCGEACQLAHWKAHRAICKQKSTELGLGKNEKDQ